MSRNWKFVWLILSVFIASTVAIAVVTKFLESRDNNQNDPIRLDLPFVAMSSEARGANGQDEPVTPARTLETETAEAHDQADEIMRLRNELAHLQASNDVLGQEFLDLLVQFRKLENENQLLRSELGRLNSNSFVDRPVFQDLYDPENQFTKEMLQDALLRFVREELPIGPYELTDSATHELARAAAEFYLMMQALSVEFAGIAVNSDLEPAAKSAAMAENGEGRNQAREAFRRRLIEIIGAERAAQWAN